MRLSGAAGCNYACSAEKNPLRKRRHVVNSRLPAQLMAGSVLDASTRVRVRLPRSRDIDIGATRSHQWTGGQPERHAVVRRVWVPLETSLRAKKRGSRPIP
eukprot:SAG31_NODE_155_length_22130_cov_9.540098_5_plen_101_part_00